MHIWLSYTIVASHFDYFLKLWLFIENMREVEEPTQI